MLAISAIALNQALWVSFGMLNPLAILLLVLASCTAFYGTFSWRIPGINRGIGSEGVLFTFIVGLAVQFAQLLTSTTGSYEGIPQTYLARLFAFGIAVSAGLVLWGLSGRFTSGGIWFLTLVLVHFILGISFLCTAPPIPIDVLTFQREASAALVHGSNPYSVTFPNIYGEHTPFYGPGAVLNGKLTYGYPYPPLTLFLSLPAHIFAGDIRYAHLAAVSLSGILIGFTGRGVVSKLAAAVYLYSPRLFQVVQSGWTEPFLVLLFSAVVFTAGRSRRTLPLLLGLLMAAKQYLIFAVPAAWLLLQKPSGKAYCRLILRSGAVALAVTLPFAIWNFGAFFRAVVLWQFDQPFRPDALSFPAFFVNMGLPRLPVFIPFLAVLFLGQHLLRRLPPTPSAFAAGMALVYLVFFSLSKQAFCNYYFFVVGSLCCTVAAADAEGALSSNEPIPMH